MMRRKTRRTSVREYAVALVLALVLLWLLYLVFDIFKKEEVARHAANDTKAELAALETREATLSENLAELKTERGREASLRETYGVARPGEEVIIVVPPEEGDDLQELSWWRKILGYFGL